MTPKSEIDTERESQSTSILANWLTLPSDLPVPIDDGLADHLRGDQPRVVLPTGVLLRATPTSTSASGDDDATIDLRKLSFEAPVLVFVYPRTGKPGIATPPGWDAIPGARGCTPELCCVRDTLSALQTVRTGGIRIVALSTQSTAYQTEVAQRLALPYPILSDEMGEFRRALKLPTFEANGMVLLKRITLLLHEGEVVGRDYPVFPTDEAARRALDLVASVFGNK
ncbi:Redoxin-domain-containing protein [Boletus edulis BED1]|uniref:Redoxin-domain-containing protein n=1 Tax=Boletus edulis BED1 TaxID=1328754 RepID=A0AAD4BH23_BOLED|nr:Redoxin-domain-containing protein [Boletus edulis BED1]